MTIEKNLDLSVGDPVVVRQALIKVGLISYIITAGDMGYKVFNEENEKQIIKFVKNYYKKQFGLEYQHIILTNGTNGALLCLMHYLKNTVQIAFNEVTFKWYKKMADIVGIGYQEIFFGPNDLIIQSDKLSSQQVLVLDSPSNPWGNQVDHNLNPNQIVWNSSYASLIYTSQAKKLYAPRHFCNIGSISKILGLSGLRLGWLATNDNLLAQNIYEIINTLSCRPSPASIEILNSFLININNLDPDLQKINLLAKNYIDDNREEFSKISSFFGAEVSDEGMFYVGNLDTSLEVKLFNIGIKGLELTRKVSSNICEKFIRFNLADDRNKTKAIVKLIQKKI